MLFNYYSKKNLNLLIEVSQITHVVFIILAALFIIHLVIKINAPHQKNGNIHNLLVLLSHGMLVVIVGVGCLINTQAVRVMQTAQNKYF